MTAGCDLCKLLAGFDAGAGAAPAGPLVWRDERLAVVLVPVTRAWCGASMCVK
jgi:hypothetical protein